MGVEKALSIDDLRKLAKRRLPRVIYDFLEGGAEDENALRRNREAYDRQILLPRYLVDIGVRNQSMTVFGETFAHPFGIAPTGVAAMVRPKADLLLTEAAAAANIPFIISGSSTCTIEDAARVWPKCWYQLYIPNDFTITTDLLKRCEKAGISTLVVTVDVPIHAKRERNIRSGYVRPYKPTLPIVIEGLRHLPWVWDYLRTGMPYQENWLPYVQKGLTSRELMAIYAKQVPSVQTWQTLESLRKLWPGKLVVKGILHPDDAVQAANIGVDGIIVSNHGGRQLDRGVCPIDMFGAVKRAVGDRVTLMIDSGIQRGADVIAALCHGAQFTFVGRATIYGVAAAGTKGVARAIDILRNEIDIAQGQIGCPDVRNLGPQYLYRPGDWS
jgi:(S)-mandelate dehydrogenase